MVAAPVAPLPSGTVAEEEQEKAATRSRQEEASTTTTTMKSVDRESIPSTSLPPPSFPPSSSSLVPNQRVRVRGVPATVRYVGPVAGKDPADTWIGLEWDDDAAASSSSSSSAEGRRGKHDGSVGGVRYFQTRGARRRKGPAAPMTTCSLVRAAALDAPGVLVVGCSVEEALVRRYRGSCIDNEKRENGDTAAAAPSPAPLPSSSSSSSSSFVAGHEEVAARLARIHELEVASVAGSPAAFCLEGEEDRREGGGKRKGDDERGAAAAKKSPLLAPLGELAPSLRALDAAGCLFSEWREVERILMALPGLERLDLTRCGGLATAAEVFVVEEEEEDEKPLPSSSSSSLSLPPPNPPRLPPPLHGLRELVLAETGTEWTSVLSALAGSGVGGLRALSLRRCGLHCLGGGGDGGSGSGGSGPAGKSRKLLLASSVLSRLEELDLSENDLSCWNRGNSGSGDDEGEDGGSGIADELGSLPSLSTLDLSRNPGLATLSSSFASLRPHSSSSSPSFAALKELRLAECGLSSWAELECLFEEEEGGEEERSGEEPKAATAAAAKSSVLLPFPRLSSLRLSGNPLPAPDPTTGCARADVVARLRMGISSLNGAKVGVRERADARRALEAARRRSRSGGGAAASGGGASLAGLSLGGKGGDSSSSVLPPPCTHSSAGIMAPMAASMLELRIVLSTEEEEEEQGPLSSSSSASAAAKAKATTAKAAAATTRKARPPVRLPGSTTVTRLRQLAARLTGVPAREQVLRVEMGRSGEEKRDGGGGGEGGSGAAAADDGDGDSPVVLLELTPADDSRDLRFLGVSSGSVVRVSRR